jgi:signal transduction histidine kinase
MSIYRLGGALLVISLLPVLIDKFYYDLPDMWILSVIYPFNIFLLIVTSLMAIYLVRTTKDEIKVLFLTVFILAALLSLSLLSVGQMVWTARGWSLTTKHFQYFFPIYLLASVPILGFFVWKILREFRYMAVKHFLPAVFAAPVIVVLNYRFFITSGVLDLVDFLQLETLLCDSVILLLLFTFVAAYFKTESATYFKSLSFYFGLKYAFDLSLQNSIKGLLSFDYSIAIFTASNVILLTVVYYFYRSEITFLSYYDLDAERKRYAELYAQVNELQEILKLINRMLRHDILNKLQIISGYIEAYKMTKNESLLEKALGAVDESSAYIEKIRELEKIVLTRSEKLTPVNVRKVAEEVAESFNIEVNVKGDCVALADEALYSVLENLVNNAIKHGKTKKVDIWLSEFEDSCEIRVVDYGLGIPSEIRWQIFKESFRYGESAGSGLGLFIVKRIVDRYGGRIWVEETKPHGATFVIRLKAARKSLKGDDERAPLKL